MKFEFNRPSGSEEKLFENVDGRRTLESLVYYLGTGLVPPRKAEWSLSGEPKASGNTFLLLSF